MRRRISTVPAEQVAHQVIEVRQKRPLSHKVIALGMAALLAVGAGVAVKLLDRVPDFSNLGPRTERETIPGFSQVIALELAKLKEFRGAKQYYSVTTELTERETKCLPLNVACKTKEDTAMLTTKGSAEGVIDLSGVTSADVIVAPDNSKVVIRLPHARPDDISASHAKGDITVVHRPNNWCELSVDCKYVSEADLLQQADAEVVKTVKNDRTLGPTTETQAEQFFGWMINVIGGELLRNQSGDPNYQPRPIDVQLEFFDPTPQLQSHA
jgi:hypothetical protein